MNILDKIKNYTITRVEMEKKNISFDQMRQNAEKSINQTHLFSNTLKKDGLSLICEIKKASPSLGVIDDKFDYMHIANEYEASGADCISCLTEPNWFLGSEKIFTDIRNKSSLAMLRKDFIVDEYQIYQSVCMGANAILLICAMLDKDTLERFLHLANNLSLDVLFETHNMTEVEIALELDAKIIGINNRNLKDFSVSFSNFAQISKFVKDDNRILVAESGIKSVEDAKFFRENGADAILIGEMLMKSSEKANLIRKLKNA